ncbi:MAG: hypothetical protein LBI53_08070 [Candidatus Peribacteria bacterium]|jgi:hypothetical protein|nr:hypothetical protein [Candidatus Peribacteria bacterium]
MTPLLSNAFACASNAAISTSVDFQTFLRSVLSLVSVWSFFANSLKLSHSNFIPHNLKATPFIVSPRFVNHFTLEFAWFCNDCNCFSKSSTEILPALNLASNSSAFLIIKSNTAVCFQVFANSSLLFLISSATLLNFTCKREVLSSQVLR